MIENYEVYHSLIDEYIVLGINRSYFWYLIGITLFLTLLFKNYFMFIPSIFIYIVLARVSRKDELFVPIFIKSLFVKNILKP